ncbi:flagellar hook-associated protein FlgL [Edaphobacter modestus]|uniref:Flagellar hook-associated protein 3 FlgL n=1 Tax=Edaphobacter modestus TaxID=388466 RepID=A0A4Q7YRT8_9BACT|nr:flagellar hook-associated protein FlgL [Edaphobacter modestus]RZU39545.1 flagellar hook-associated protein 3 FlgL [Edaphobacter modestus]
MRADPTYFNSVVQSLNNAMNNSNNLAAELSSGLRVGSLSDDPAAATQSLRLDGTIAGIDTFVQTASGVSSRLQMTDSTLGEVVSQVTSAISLAVGAANGTLNSANLDSIAQQVTSIRDNVLSLANSSYQGSFLFSGSQGTTTPFSLNTTTTPATTNYQGDSNVQTIVTPGGQKIQISLPGSSIFGSGSSGVLGVLNQLVSDLTSGAPTANISADSSALTDALSTVSTQRSVLNNSLSTIQSTSTYAQTQEAQLKVQQGSLVASDPAAVATGLQASQTQYQALLSVITALQQDNLFNHLS